MRKAATVYSVIIDYPQLTPEDSWPGPVVLDSGDLLSRWGFDSGLLLAHHAAWQREQLGICRDHPYVDEHDLLRVAIERNLLPRLGEEEREEVACQAQSFGRNPFMFAGGADRTHREITLTTVSLDRELRELLDELCPPRRGCDYELIKALSQHLLPWRPVLGMLTGEHPEIVSLAAENITHGLATGTTERDAVDMVNEALDLARLAYE